MNEQDEFKEEIIKYISENVKTLTAEKLIKLSIVQLVIIKTEIELGNRKTDGDRIF